MQQKSLIGWLGILFRGMAMGAADVVPGVSGGTIAFITGIYEELINSIANINLRAIQRLRSEGVKSFWLHINGNFFAALFIGIGCSVFSLAKLLTHLLENYPVVVWSFFFGLVVASALFVIKTIKGWNTPIILALLLGIVVAAYISSLQTTFDGHQLWYIFISGAIAICAMILPGISGAFILVLLGSYHVIINGIKDVDLKIISLFGLGCIVGLLLFSRLLKFLFSHYKNIVLAILSGFLIGSLVKIWPWKNKWGETPIITHSDGREEFLMENVMPDKFNDEPQLITAIGVAILGFLLVLVLEKVAKK